MNSTVETFSKFVTACKKKGVEHFVKISFYEIPGDPYNDTVPFVQFQRQCDELITGRNLTTRMTYTILAASHHMSTALIHQGQTFREEEEKTDKYSVRPLRQHLQLFSSLQVRAKLG